MKKPTQKKPSVRLSKDIVPTHYTVLLHPDLEAHTFSGKVTISMNLAKPAKEITLHSVDLAIASGEVLVGKKMLTASKISYNEKRETATFHFLETIPKGKAVLSTAFTGVLKDNMRGFYKSRYVVDGEERIMATTQFEATDARRAIPCFDEPAQKAVFEVSLVTPLDKMAISNTLPVSIAEHSAGLKVVSFAPTPKMSTYLLAFIIGDFEHIEKKTKSGVLVRVLTIPGKTHQAKFALDCTVRCLEFYEDYFAVPYPLNTLDMIAIPDFSSLAMENWGAITFREIGLLVDEKETSTAYRQMVALVIAHELAHQWFGNLVTMEWWTHLWLNEGFATYIEHFAVAELYPEYDVWSQFVVATTGHGLGNALRLDALKNTHPIEVEVHHPNEIGEVFDIVSYDKGASVIRMLAEYLGPKHFRDGLRSYLKKHSYSNASTIHLWEAFEKVSKKPVRKMMNVWTGKSGYPLLSAELAKGVLTLSQKRYFSSPKSAAADTGSTVWPVPLAYTTDKGVVQAGLMTGKRLSLPAPKALWIKCNAHESAIYRTHYGPTLLGALAAAVASGKLSSVDRLGIVRDMLSLSESGQYETPTLLAFAELYVHETEYIVWVELVSGMRSLAQLLYGSPAYDSFRAYARGIFASAALRVGWEAVRGESDNEAMTRSLVLGAASYFGDTAVIKEAFARFEKRVAQPIAPDLRGVVYGTIAREGGEKEYALLLALYRSESLHEEKNRLLSALGQFKSKKLLQQTLAFTMTNEVRMQDRNGAFASVLVNVYGRTLGWEFLKKNWDKIGKAYGDGNHLLSRLIGVLSRNTTREAAADIRTFFKTHSAPAAERTLEQTLEYIESNVRWLARDGKKIAAWLADKKYE